MDASRKVRTKRDIGRISEWLTGTDILAYIPDQIAGGRKFSTTFDAVAFLMRRCGLQPCRRWTGEFIEPEEKVSPDRDEDLDYHLSPGDRLPPRRAWSEESVNVDDDGCIPW